MYSDNPEKGTEHFFSNVSKALKSFICLYLILLQKVIEETPQSQTTASWKQRIKQLAPYTLYNNNNNRDNSI